MISPYCINTVDFHAQTLMKPSHDKRRKPVFSLGRRMGRKGDPKMHRAVQARLADPNISLFHALKTGGFNYIDDIDGKAIDEEGVTLAQRKNQLSRRLRMAKTTQDAGPKKAPNTNRQTLDDLVEAQQANFQNLLRQTSGGSSIASVDAFPDHESTNHDVHSVHDEMAMDNAPVAQQDQKMGAIARSYLPPPPAAARRSDSDSLTNLHPEPPRLSSRMTSRTINDTETGTPMCSEFGLRSLHRTAQSIGLTLDQLALVLSSTDNLAARLGIPKENEEGV